MLFPFLSCQEGDKEHYQGIKSPFFVHTEVFCFRCLLHFSKIQLVVYHQCCVLIGLATSRLYVIAH